MNFIDDMLGGKNNKEANLISQGENREDHFERKVKAHDWINGVTELDPVQVEAEYQQKLRDEAMTLGKTAALDDVIADGTTPEETVNRDYKRDVSSLSDYALAELLAEARGHKAQNTSEMFYELKEKAKSEVASSREKAEKALLELIPDSAQLDWQKAFKEFTKDATPAEAKEKDLFRSDVPEKAHDFQHPTEEKFKLPKDPEKAIPGNGREADERTDATKEAGVLQADIVEGIGKNASVKEGKGYSSKDPFARYTTKTKAGNTLQFFYNPENNLLVVALISANENGGNELLRQTLDESGLLGHTEGIPLEESKKAAAQIDGTTEDLSKTADPEMTMLESFLESHPDIMLEMLMERLSPAEKADMEASFAEMDEPAETPIQGLASIKAKLLKKKAFDQMNPGNQPPASEANDAAIVEAFKQALEGGGEEVMVDLLMQYMPIEDMKSILDDFSDTGTFEPDTEHFEHAGIPMAVSFLKFRSLKRASMCPVCGQAGKDLKNASKEHMACASCGITYSNEIKSSATKADVIKKVAELQKTAEVKSPWAVTTDENGQEVIARVDETPTNTKESEEDKVNELQK